MNGLPPFLIPLLTLLALAMAGLLIAWLIRYVGGGKSRRQAEGSASLLAGSGPEISTDSGSEQDLVLCVSRTRDAEVIITVRGQPYSRLRDIKDPAVGRLAVEAVKGVLLFAEDLLPASVRRSLRSAKQQAKSSAEVKSTTGPAGEQAQLAPRQLVHEIDELVQERLRESPALADRGIRLREGTGGGLVIFVGNDHYESVEAVPDEEVRSVIEQAIEEWERR
jgi:hypothetical protein